MKVSKKRLKEFTIQSCRKPIKVQVKEGVDKNMPTNIKTIKTMQDQVLIKLIEIFYEFIFVFIH